MSSTDDSDANTPVWFMQAETSGYLMSILVGAFMIGLYSYVFFATFYLYITKKASQQKFILCMITLIYLLTLFVFSVRWQVTYSAFVANGDILDDIYDWLYMDSNSLNLANITCQNFIIVIADGLLIWRAYNVWERRRIMVIIPTFLWIVEFGLAVTITAIQLGPAEFSSNPTPYGIFVLNALTASLFFISVGTSLMSTYLIAHRIYQVTRSKDHFSRRSIKRVLDIVVQSAVGYTLSLLVMGVYDVLPLTDDPRKLILNDDIVDNMGEICTVLISLMPTLMVGRVAMLSGEDTSVSIDDVHRSEKQQER